jgi:hypothetical protein
VWEVKELSGRGEHGVTRGHAGFGGIGSGALSLGESDAFPVGASDPESANGDRAPRPAPTFGSSAWHMNDCFAGSSPGELPCPRGVGC